MRVGVPVSHAAVRRPARVADADPAGHLVQVQVLVDFYYLAGPLAYKDVAAVKGGDSDAVVAPVFHPLQAVNQDRGRGVLALVADNRAQSTQSTLFMLKTTIEL